MYYMFVFMFIYVLFNNFFSHVWTVSCIPGLNKYYVADECLAQGQKIVIFGCKHYSIASTTSNHNMNVPSTSAIQLKHC